MNMNVSDVSDFADVNSLIVIDNEELVIDGRRECASMNDFIAV